MEPKFKTGQLVKINLDGVDHFNFVLEPVYNKHCDAYLYRLDEPMAMPVYREEWLSAATTSDAKRLNEAMENGTLRRSKLGEAYIETDTAETC